MALQLSDTVQHLLREEQEIWLTTVRRDGQPQPIPVWFLWDGESFLIYSKPRNQKLRNIQHNPLVSLNLGREDHVVRLEGRAEILSDAPSALEVPEYLEKYGDGITNIGYTPESFAEEYSVAMRVTPARYYGW